MKYIMSIFSNFFCHLADAFIQSQSTC